MRGRDLVRKELAELAASRAWWLLLIAAGVLTGQSFITAVNAYAEASGIGGGPSALPQALSPLDGIFVPTLGAYDLVITLLLPFVVIRLVSSEKTSGALKLMLQWPAPLAAQLVAKVGALLIAWGVSLLPFAMAVILWRTYGGHIASAELLNLLLGYTLHVILTATIAMAAAAMMPGAANAAIVVLAFTIGTWALDFIATGRGGWMQQLAAYTPAATLRQFERGLIRLDIVLVILLLAGLAFALAESWLRPGRTVRTQLTRSAVLLLAAAIAVLIASRVHASFDVSEDRRNSFGVSDEQMLASIHAPLTITVNLAAEDPRMMDFERNVLTKLRRVRPDADVRSPLAGRSALFESDDRYGTITYRVGARNATNRSTTEEIVLDTIYALAGRQPPPRTPSTYAGHPLAARPRGAAPLFYIAWPVAVLACAIGERQRHS